MRIVLWRLHCVGLLVLGFAAESLFGVADDPPREPVGAIYGVVRFTGKVPPAKQIMTTDGGVLQHHDLIVDSKTKGLRFVFATLEDAPVRPKLEKAPAVLLDQRDMVFLPRVIAVQDGQPVRLENNDLCNHSVMAASTVKENEFNIFVDPGKPREHVFAVQKHPVQVGCSIHAWMRAWVYVVPHPWFAVSDEKGRFVIERVPPGKYTLLLRHADTGRLERRQLQIEAGKKTEVQVDWTDSP